METPRRCVRFVTASSIYTYSSEAIPSILIVDSDAPTRDAREQMVRQPSPGGPSAGKTEPVGRLPDVRSLVTLFPAPSQVSYGATPSPAPSGGPIDDPGILRILLELPRSRNAAATRIADSLDRVQLFRSRVHLAGGPGSDWRQISRLPGRPFAIGPPAGRLCVSTTWNCRKNSSRN